MKNKMKVHEHVVFIGKCVWLRVSSHVAFIWFKPKFHKARAVVMDILNDAGGD